MSIRSLARRLKPQITFVDPFPEISRAILIISSGRSGSTLLLHAMAAAGGCRQLFEPLAAVEIPQAKTLFPNPCTYIRPNDARRELERQYWDKVLCGRLRHPWTDRFNRTHFATRRIVKSVRANLMIGWLQRQFSDVPTVFLIRHPLAVAQSKAQLQDWHGWEDDIETLIFQQEALMTDCLARHTEFLRAAESPIQKFTALWAVENAVAISQIDLSRTHLIAFEQLCTDPGRILGRLGQFLGVAYGRKSIDLFSQPSGTAQAKARNAAIVPTEEDQRYAAEALERFRLDWLYAGDRKVMPGDLNAKGRRLAENIRDATGHDSSEAVR